MTTPQPPDQMSAHRPPPKHAPWPWRGFAAAGAAAALVLASFLSLDLQWQGIFSAEGAGAMARFVGEFYPPDVQAPFLWKVFKATWETLAMSALGTGLAACGGLLLAWPASRWPSAPLSRGPGHRWVVVAGTLRRQLCKTLLNALRAIPELVWAALLLVAAGLGPLAGTLALALHTTGVLGRLFSDAIENTPAGPSLALQAQGATPGQRWWYATWPQVLPQLLSYTLYRWENNIRAATVLGVVGAGGLGQLLSFHLGLFHMGKTATLLMAMLALVWLVDGLSLALRRRLTR